MQSQPLQRAHVAAYLLIALVFLYLRTFLLPGVPVAASGDETMFFAHGIRLLYDQTPYVGYENFVMPGCDLFYAAAFGLFGVHAWLAQGFFILLGVTLSGLLLWISRSILQGVMVFLPGLLFLVLDFNTVMDATHHWYSDAFLLAAAGVLLGGRETPRIFAAGALCGVAAVFTQSQGLLVFLAIAGWLWWTSERPAPQRVRQLAILTLPFAAIVGGVLLWLVSRAGFATIYFSFVTFVTHYFPTMTIHTPRAYLLNRPSGTALVPYLFIHLMLPFGYLWALVRLWRERSSLDRTLWNRLMLVTVTGLALFLAVANAPSPRRMVMVAPPAAIVCVWLLREARLRMALWAVAIAGLVAFSLQTQRHWHGYVDLPIGRSAFLQSDDFAEAQWLVQHTHAGDSAFTLPRTNFLLALDNPTALDFIVPAEYTTAAQIQRAIQDIETHRALFVYLPVVREEIRAPGHPGNNLGPLIAYMQANYQLVKTFPDQQIWERN